MDRAIDKDLARHLPGVRGLVMPVVVAGLLVTVAVIAQMALLSHIIGAVFLQSASRVAVWPMLLLLLLASAARAGLSSGRELLARRAAIHAKSALRRQLVARVLRLGPAYSRDERSGELVTTATEGIERLDGYVSRYLPQVYLSVLVPLAIVLVVAPLDFTSAILLIVTAPVIPILMVLIGKHAENHIAQQWEGLTRMGAHFLDMVYGLPTLILFGRAEAESTRVARISERFRERTMGALRVAFLSGLVLEFMIACAIGVIAVALGVRLLNGGIGFERAFLILLLTPEFYRPLRDLGAHRHAAMEGQAALKRIAEILDTPLPAAQAAAGSSDATDHEISVTNALTLALRDVTYTYSGSEEPALAGVSLTLQPGTCTALVGPSGAGKTTLVNVLMRFLDPQAGVITANGLPLDQVPVEEWRACIGLVPQRPYLFAASVRENLRLARPAASDDEITAAAKLAGADEFIRALPQGYETPIGERGARLSAGQAQRLAIARAFLKDAPLLVLDEPTSNLDPESEAHIRQALQVLMRGRTVLVIAHRMNTVRSADQVVVLDRGRIAALTEPAEILAGDGVFARIVAAVQSDPAAQSIALDVAVHPVEAVG